jgi:hypothetical protein
MEEYGDEDLPVQLNLLSQYDEESCESNNDKS